MVTAELAIAIPALLLVVAVILSAIRWSLDAITASSVTAEAAHAVMQGEAPEGVMALARDAVPRGEWSWREEPDAVCVTTVLPPPLPLLGPVMVEQCAHR